MKIQGISFDGKFFSEEQHKMNSYLSGLRNGVPLTDEIRPLERSKTDKQLATYFGLLMEKVVTQADDKAIDTSEFLRLIIQDDLPSGNRLDKNFLYELLLKLCPVCRSGKKLTLSKMTTVELSKFYELCWNLMSSRGFDIPKPQKDWREKK